MKARVLARDRILLALLVAVLALVAPAALRLPLDVENLSMKSTGTAAAEAEALRAREFGHEPTVLLLARPRVTSEWLASDDEELAAWVGALETHPDLAQLVRLPQRPGRPNGELVLAVRPAVGPDGRYAAAVARLVADARRTLPSASELAAAGPPVVELALSRELARERNRIVPVLLGVMALVLVIVYRSPALVLAALLPPIGGALGLGALQAVAGCRLDPVSSLLAPVVLTVGVAGAVHVTERYLVLLRHGADVARASRDAVRELRGPFALTVATTVCGFLGLEASAIPAVRAFGLWAAAGVVLCTLLAYAVQPVALRALHRAPHARLLPVVEQWGLASRFALLGRRHARAAVALVAVASVALALGWSTVRVESDPLTILPREHRVRRDADLVREATGVRATFDLVLPQPAHGRALPLLPLAAWLAALPGLAGVGEVRTAPSGAVLVTVLVADEARQAGDAREMAPLLADALRVARDVGATDAVATGLAARVDEDSRALVTGQLQGLASTLLVLVLVMAIGFRSLSLALLGLVPNVLPCLAIYGGMGFLGRPLSVSSAMIGTVILGLIVDDTIHYIDAYRRARATGGRRGASLLRASRAVGRAIVVTSVCLAAGFASTLGGRLETTREFGLLATTVVAVALLSDLFLVPAVLTLRPLLARRTVARPEPPCSAPTITTS